MTEHTINIGGALGYVYSDQLESFDAVGDQETITRLRQQVLDLESKLNSLKWQIRMKDEALRQKNLALDAYHYVWCNGGCSGGIHRYHDAPLTEAIVAEAERNTRRLRQGFDNMVFRSIWSRLSSEEKGKILNDCHVAKVREWSDVVSELKERFSDEQIARTGKP